MVVRYPLFVARKITILLFDLQILVEQIRLIIPSLLVVDQAEIDELGISIDVRIQNFFCLIKFSSITVIAFSE